MSAKPVPEHVASALPDSTRRDRARSALERHDLRDADPQPSTAAEPRGILAIRTLAMPADTNPMGDIFGGWLMALMDSAGKMTATQHANGRVVTVAVSNIAFLQPVKVGDTVCCYTQVKRRGRTSLTLAVEVWVLRQGQGERVKVTDAEFTFVAVNDQGQPRPVAAAKE
jgi:acyl-CoA thioesterase YciA